MSEFGGLWKHKKIIQPALKLSVFITMKTLLTIRKEQVEESDQTTRHGRQLFFIYCRLCTGTFQFLVLCTGQCVLLSHGCLLNMQFVFNYLQQQPDLYLKYEIFSELSTSSIIKTNLPRSLLSLVLQHSREMWNMAASWDTELWKFAAKPTKCCIYFWSYIN